MATLFLPTPCSPGKAASFTMCYWGVGKGGGRNLT